MKPKRARPNDELAGLESSSSRKEPTFPPHRTQPIHDDVPVPSSSTLNNDPTDPKKDPISQLYDELSRAELNVETIGQIIADSLISGSLKEEDLSEITRNAAINLQNLGAINIVDLADRLNTGVIDSRYVLIGNAFMWNTLKATISTVREKFDNLSFKVCHVNDQNVSKFEFNRKNLMYSEYLVMSEGLFQTVDLFPIFTSITFRRSADLHRKAKHIIKSYLVKATYPKCAIWHYGLRLSGSSHKKTIQDMPITVVRTVVNFLLELVGLGQPELQHGFVELDQTSDFFEMLGDTEEQRIAEFGNMKQLRETLVSKFRSCISEALNEVREMPFNIGTRELQAPPRGKPLDPNCVTWKQYEELIKRCVENPSSENLKAKEEIEVQLEYDCVDPVLSTKELKAEEEMGKTPNEIDRGVNMKNGGGGGVEEEEVVA